MLARAMNCSPEERPEYRQEQPQEGLWLPLRFRDEPDAVAAESALHSLVMQRTKEHEVK